MVKTKQHFLKDGWITKLSVQKLLFPEGIVIDPNDRTYRTSYMNPIFRLIHSLTGDKDDFNKKRTSKNTSPSCLVEHPEKKSNSITDSLAQFSKLFSN